MLFNMPPFEKSRLRTSLFTIGNRRRLPGLPSPAYIETLEQRADIRRTVKKTEHTVGESRSGFQYGSVNRGPRHLLPIVSLIATIVRRMTRTGCIAATHRTDKAMCLSGQGFPKGSRSSEHCTRDRIQRYSLYQDTDDCVSLPSVS